MVKRRTESSINRLGQDGIKLLNLVIPKPEIPPDIAANYKQVRHYRFFSVLRSPLGMCEECTSTLAVARGQCNTVQHFTAGALMKVLSVMYR